MGIANSSFQELPDLISKEDVRDWAGKRYDKELYDFYKNSDGFIQKSMLQDLQSSYHVCFIATTTKHVEEIQSYRKLLVNSGLHVFWNASNAITSAEKQLRIDMAQTIVLIFTDPTEEIQQNISNWIELVRFAAKTKPSSVVVPVVSSRNAEEKWSSLLQDAGIGIDWSNKFFIDLVNCKHDVSSIYDHITKTILTVAVKSSLTTSVTSFDGLDSRRLSGTTNSSVKSKVRLLSSLKLTEVQQLMENLNMKKYIPIFQENEVDGRVLNNIASVSELIELGVNVKVKARVFFDELNAFKLSGVPDYLIQPVSNIQSIASTMTDVSTLAESISSKLKYEEEESGNNFRVGTLIEANFRGKGKWYRGIIDAMRRNGKFDVLYDDGELEQNISIENIRIVNTGKYRDKKNTYTVDDTVDVNYKDRGIWRAAKVFRVNNDGSVDVRYYDGEVERSISPSSIRENQLHESPTKMTYLIGDRVEANFRGKGLFYHGVISRVRMDYTYDVSYDNGEFEMSVSVDLIRPIHAYTQKINANKANRYRVGDKIEANYKGNGRWYGGIIEHINAENSYDILYDDRVRETAVQADMIRTIDRPEDIMSSRKLQEGDKVEANYRDWGKWYPGKITRCRVDGSFDISYDDGESETRVSFDKIRLIKSSRTQNLNEVVTYQKGDKIEANYRNRGKWYSGKVTCVHNDETYDIMYDDGEKETNVSPINIRLSETRTDDAVRKFTVDQKVELNFRGRGKWYKGKITKCRDDNTYDVRYDDGDSETRISEKFIRIINDVSSAIRFREEEKVEAKFSGKHWCRGVIKKVNRDDTYDILYDDGNREKYVSSNLIRRITNENISSRPYQFSEGDKIEANYKGRGKWYSGKIKYYHSETDRYDISYDDGETEERIDANMIRMRNVESNSSVSNNSLNLEEGDIIEANYKGRGKWYPGKVKHRRDDNKYDILYDDGEVDVGVSLERIRLVGNGMRKFKIDEAIELNYRGKGRWFGGKIQKVQNNTYDVMMDDGEIEQAVESKYLRSKQEYAAGSAATMKSAAIHSSRHRSERNNTNSDDSLSDGETSCDFSTNDRVEVNYGGLGKWFPAKIVSKRRNGNYNIIYDDGDKEMNVEINCIRKMNIHAKSPNNQEVTQDYRQGEKVFVKSTSGKYIQGSILSKETKNIYSVEFNDGSIDKNVNKHLIRKYRNQSDELVKFKKGDKIIANHFGNGKWFEGDIIDVNRDGTYNILYYHGEEENNVIRDYIKLKEATLHGQSELSTFSEGDKIEANYKSTGHWFEGVIRRKRLDDTYDIDYDDGDSETFVSASNIRKASINLSAIGKIDSKSADANLQSNVNKMTFIVGERVEANFANRGKWYGALIVQVNSNNTYNIQYDDNDTESNLDSTVIRKIGKIETVPETTSEKVDKTNRNNSISTKEKARTPLSSRKLEPNQTSPSTLKSTNAASSSPEKTPKFSNSKSRCTPSKEHTNLNTVNSTNFKSENPESTTIIEPVRSSPRTTSAQSPKLSRGRTPRNEKCSTPLFISSKEDIISLDTNCAVVVCDAPMSSRKLEPEVDAPTQLKTATSINSEKTPKVDKADDSSDKITNNIKVSNQLDMAELTKTPISLKQAVAKELSPTQTAIDIGDNAPKNYYGLVSTDIDVISDANQRLASQELSTSPTETSTAKESPKPMIFPDAGKVGFENAVGFQSSNAISQSQTPSEAVETLLNDNRIDKTVDTVTESDEKAPQSTSEEINCLRQSPLKEFTHKSSDLKDSVDINSSSILPNFSGSLIVHTADADDLSTISKERQITYPSKTSDMVEPMNNTLCNHPAQTTSPQDISKEIRKVGSQKESKDIDVTCVPPISTEQSYSTLVDIVTVTSPTALKMVPITENNKNVPSESLVSHESSQHLSTSAESVAVSSINNDDEDPSSNAPSVDNVQLNTVETTTVSKRSESPNMKQTDNRLDETTAKVEDGVVIDSNKEDDHKQPDKRGLIIASPIFQPNDRIEGNYASQGRWYPGRIININDNNTYDIEYDDGDCESQVDKENIRTNEKISPMKTNRSNIGRSIDQEILVLEFNVGDVIQCNYASLGRWYAGKISKVHADSTYDIDYEDGDQEKYVQKKNIRYHNETATDLKGDVNSMNTDDESFSIGDCVNVNYQGSGTWYTGKISCVNTNKTYHVDYDDGDKEFNVKHSNVRKLQYPAVDTNTVSLRAFQVGDEVEANYADKGRWYSGKIANKRDNNCYDILYNDGDEEYQVPWRLIRPRNDIYADSSKSVAKYMIGCRVEANSYGYGVWYSGVVNKINDDDSVGVTYEVKYDDGEVELRVLEEMIRNFSSAHLSDKTEPVQQVVVGSQVLGNYKSKGQWFRGDIINIVELNGVNTFEVNFADLDTQSCTEDMIRLATQQKPGRFFIGEQVEAKYHSIGEWNQGRIKSDHGDGTYHILYTNGEEDLRLIGDLIRSTDRVAQLLEGDQIEGNYRGRGVWYPGKILHKNRNRTFDIIYDDGETEYQVDWSLVRLFSVVDQAAAAALPIQNDSTNAYSDFPIGSRVLSNYKCLGMWFTGTILSYTDSDKTYQITYDDMDTQPAAPIMIRLLPLTTQRTFQEGEEVEAYIKSLGCWKNAIVTKARAEGTYDVKYESDEDKRILPDMLRPIDPSDSGDYMLSTDQSQSITNHSPIPSNEPQVDDDHGNTLIGRYSVGDKVLVNYKGLGKWYSGKIDSLSFSEQREIVYNILYDDGDEESDVTESFVRLISRELELKIVEGSDVNVNYHGTGKWLKGRVTVARDDGTYDITYEDGELDARILRESIDPMESKAITPIRKKHTIPVDDKRVNEEEANKSPVEQNNQIDSGMVEPF